MMDLTSAFRPKILLVDDDTLFLRAKELSLRAHYEVFTANTVELAQTILSREKVDAIVTDLDFQGQPKDGLFLLDWALERYPAVPVLVLSGDANADRVISATKRKLADVISKSETHEKNLTIALDKAMILRKKILSLKEHPARFRTQCRKIQKALDEIDVLALKGAKLPILITGETGCGKEFVAKHIAAVYKKRLVAANMATLDEATADSELFGHARGAFTGANAEKPGLIEQAHQGIFFLDELGDCPLPVQIKLLRTLDTGELRRKGSNQTRIVDVQFVGATNRNIPEMIRRGQFRLDVYERINSITIHLPPLRERLEDIRYYLNLYIDEFSKFDRFTISDSGMAAALNYSWPGNLRELHKFVQLTVLTYSKKEIDAEAVENWISSRKESDGTVAASRSMSDRDRLILALNKADGNRSLAAEILEIDYTTVLRKMRKHDLMDMFVGKPGRPSSANRQE